MIKKLQYGLAIFALSLLSLGRVEPVFATSGGNVKPEFVAVVDSGIFEEILAVISNLSDSQKSELHETMVNARAGNAKREEIQLEVVNLLRTFGYVLTEQPGSQAQFELDQSYPNPFANATRIPFQVPRTTVVQITIIDSSGQIVRELVHETLNSGRYEVIWNGQDAFGAAVPSGVYFVRMTAGRFDEVERLTLRAA